MAPCIKNARKIVTLCILVVLLPGLSGFAESAYTYDLLTDSIIGAASLGVFAAPFFIPNEPPPPGATLDPAQVNGFDRRLMFSYEKTLDIFSSVAAYGFLLVPVLPVLGNIDRPEAIISYGVMYAEAFFLTFGTKDLLKALVNRDRPYRYFDPFPAGQEGDYHNSFPSGHTALAFMSAAFLTSTFSAEFPDSPWKLPLITAAYSLALTVGAARISSGNHFLSDVLAGAAIGSLYGYLIPALHLRKRGEDQPVEFTPTPGGFSLSARW
jgi:membrane-associated phospholipid phosphatase